MRLCSAVVCGGRGNQVFNDQGVFLGPHHPPVDQTGDLIKIGDLILQFGVKPVHRFKKGWRQPLFGLHGDEKHIILPKLVPEPVVGDQGGIRLVKKNFLHGYRWSIWGN